MDTDSKFCLLRTSTLLFEILSLFEFFNEENTSHVALFLFFGLPGIPLPRTGGTERRAPLQFSVSFPHFSPQNTIEYNVT